MCTPPPFVLGVGGGMDGLSFLLNFQKGRRLVQRVVAWKYRGDFFQGGCRFYIKINLKSEIFNSKKGL